jgi:tRNA threonylcarbamoyladenosine biosynthesis protein TsaB
VSLVGFDTSLPTTSACVSLGDGRTFFTPAPSAERLLGPAQHSQELLAELERLLDESGTTWNDVEAIAVGIGPGTFTGLRIGVATARALGQALGVGLIPVSSLEALAAGAVPEPDGAVRRVLSLIDARRGQVFDALYECGRPELVPVWDPEVSDPDELLKRVSQLDPEPICVGDWAIKSRSELEGAGVAVPSPDSGLHAVSGLQVCRLAANVEAVAPAGVYPLYLRLPDAEITRQRTFEPANPDDSQDR